MNSTDVEVSAFLEGEDSAVARLRAAIEAVVQSFEPSKSEMFGELTQESMARLFISLCTGRFRGESSLKTYAQNLARYTCLERLRSRRPTTGVDFEKMPTPARWAGPEDVLLESEERESHLKDFAALPLECQQLLRLIFVDGLSYREVAEHLGISVTAVKSRVHRCRLGTKAARHLSEVRGRGRG